MRKGARLRPTVRRYCWSRGPSPAWPRVQTLIESAAQMQKPQMGLLHLVVDPAGFEPASESHRWSGLHAYLSDLILLTARA
jgi:hypothetical protein